VPPRIVASAAVAVAAFVLVAGCSSSRSPSPVSHAVHGHPDLAGFLALPVASPSMCPPNVNGTTAGRRSPWVGAVDVSVFVDSDASMTKLRPQVAALPDVAAVFTETGAQAYAEFQRLYTCSAAVPASAVLASLRLVLATLDLTKRDALVRQLLRLPGVDTVACDPSAPCVDVVRSASPTPTGR
jgi:hypothetical protein